VSDFDFCSFFLEAQKLQNKTSISYLQSTKQVSFPKKLNQFHPKKRFYWNCKNTGSQHSTTSCNCLSMSQGTDHLKQHVKLESLCSTIAAAAHTSDGGWREGAQRYIDISSGEALTRGQAS
jgi:hypothetical protein